MKYDYLIVGAGFSGAVCAERLAKAGKKVLVIDKREHLAGNCYDYKSNGCRVHKYGPHLFHTNSKKVFDYLSQFTAWDFYEHRVLAFALGNFYQFPVNRNTIIDSFGLLGDFTEEQAQARIDLFSKAFPNPKNAKEQAIARVGKSLYEMFYEGYTRKQWGCEPELLSPSVTARIPVRSNTDDRYFTDKYQFMPIEGYTALFERILDNPNITIQLGYDWRKAQHEIAYEKLIFTGPIDEYYSWCFGPLPYRSLSFIFQNYSDSEGLPAPSVNYPGPEPYTRKTDFGKISPLYLGSGVICTEHPSSVGEPYYPMPTKEAQELYSRYKAIGDTQKDVIFAGRLGTYQYYNIDQVVAQALHLMEKEID